MNIPQSNDLNTSNDKKYPECDEELQDYYVKEILSQYWHECLLQENKNGSNLKNIKAKIQNILLNKDKGPFFQPFMVQTSLHHIVGSSAPKQPSDNIIPEDFEIGDDSLKRLLNPSVKSKGGVITIRGPQGTYKTIIARNFLLNGLKLGKSVLLIRLSERASFNPKEYNRETKKTPWIYAYKNELTWENGFNELVARQINDAKRILNVFEYSQFKSVQSSVNQSKMIEKPPRIIELALKSGALMPEEFLEFVRDIIRENKINHKIERVVLSDVASIGTSYPFLRKSKTAGDLFLSAFVHIMKNYEIDLLMTGTTGLFEASDDMVNRVSELADSVLITETCEVFGDRYITITGEGLNASKQSVEYVPAVISYGDSNEFSVDLRKLQGLVGFDSKKIHRPGLTFHMFKQPGSIFEGYRKEIQELLEDAMASKRIPGEGENRELVELKPFDSSLSGPYHASLDVLKGKPLDRTVIYMLDDFWRSGKYNEALVDLKESVDEKENEKIDFEKKFKKTDSDYIIWPRIEQRENKDSVFGVPFYNNVLLLAYRYDALNVKKSEQIFKKTEYEKTNLSEWDKIHETGLELRGNLKDIEINGSKYKKTAFDCDTEVKETLSCLLMDAYISSALKPKNTRPKEFNPKESNHSNANGPANVNDMICKHIADRKEWNRREIDRNGLKNRAIVEIDHGKAISELLKSHLDKDNYVAINAFHIARLFSEKQRIPIAKNDLERGGLYPNAALYVCWYSQLHQLINDHPWLSNKIRAVPLPGLGFRGDWYLGIAKGSVSLNLAMDVIGILTREKEEFNRLVKGVGLPTLAKFLNKNITANGTSDPSDPRFFELPLPSLMASNDIFNIHYRAFSRSHIPNYADFRQMLSVILEEIIHVVSDTGKEKQTCLEEIDKIIKRIPAQIELLTGK